MALAKYRFSNSESGRLRGGASGAAPASLAVARGRFFTRAEAGFTLVETLVATTMLAVALTALAELFVISVRNNAVAKNGTFTSVLASQKMEQLRGLTYGFDVLGLPITDTTTDTSVSPGYGYEARLHRSTAVSAAAGTFGVPISSVIRNWPAEGQLNCILMGVLVETAVRRAVCNSRSTVRDASPSLMLPATSASSGTAMPEMMATMATVSSISINVKPRSRKACDRIRRAIEQWHCHRKYGNLYDP